MNKLLAYSPNDKMALLIGGDEMLLQVMTCFGISLGFGDKTVKEVCLERGIDCATFLTVVNFVADGYSRIDTTFNDISLRSLTKYLRSSHVYFLEYLLPSIRKKLERSIEFSSDKVARLILQSFDEYMSEVQKHMDFEDKTVFDYVEDLLDGKIDSQFKITTYSKHHDLVSDRLKELKNILIKYTPEDVNHFYITAALFEIYACEKGLEWHCKVEDYLFSPVVYNLERKQEDDENK